MKTLTLCGILHWRLLLYDSTGVIPLKGHPLHEDDDHNLYMLPDDVFFTRTTFRVRKAHEPVEMLVADLKGCMQMKPVTRLIAKPLEKEP